MSDIYCLKIEVNLPSQMKLIDMILDVEHDVEEPDTWVLTMEYDETFGDLPVFYIHNFISLLRGKFGDLDKIGIRRDMISIWRCVSGPEEVFMEYWPEEMQMMASEGIKFRQLCRVEQPDERPEIFKVGGFQC